MHTFVALFHGHLPEDFHIIQLLGKIVERIHFCLQAICLLGNFLGFVRIIPETGGCHLVVQVLDPFFFFGNRQAIFELPQMSFQFIDLRA